MKPSESGDSAQNSRFGDIALHKWGQRVVKQRRALFDFKDYRNLVYHADCKECCC